MWKWSKIGNVSQQQHVNLRNTFVAVYCWCNEDVKVNITLGHPQGSDNGLSDQTNVNHVYKILS